MIGPPLQLGITHLPVALLIVTPIAVSVTGTSTVAVLLWLLAVLLLNMHLNMRPLWEPEKYQLESIAASHYVEYVRWSLDVLEEPYEEVESVGILGVLLFGRLIPVLHVAKYKTVIANSRDIVRYLYSKHMLENRAAFLKPVGGQAVDLEQRFEKLGGFARQWMLYYNFVVTGDQGRDLTLRTWGLHQQRVQAWQRYALQALYPVLKTAVARLLKVDEAAYRRAVLEIEKTFDVVDELLADGRKYLLNTPQKTYLDMYLACMAAPALRPPEYSGGRIEPASKIRLDELSPAARKELERWRMRPTGKFVLRLFAEERGLSKCLL